MSHKIESSGQLVMDYSGRGWVALVKSPGILGSIHIDEQMLGFPFPGQHVKVTIEVIPATETGGGDGNG